MKNLFALRFKGNWVFLDEEARILELDVKPVFIKETYENTFLVETETGMGLIENTGNWLIHPETIIQPKVEPFGKKNNEGLLSKYSTHFVDGLSPAQHSSSKYGYIDKSGNWIIEPKYTSLVIFSGGYGSVMNDGLWGVINTKGELVIDCQFSQQVFFVNGKATMQRKGYQGYGIIDSTGSIVLPEQFADVSGISEDFIAAKKGRLWGYYDFSGKQVFPEIFDMARPFKDQLAVVCFKGKYGFINKSGDFVIQPVYSGASPFSEGLANVLVGNRSGFIDLNGELAIAPVFESVSGFTNGYAKVLIYSLHQSGGSLHSLMDGYYHYLNKEGQFLHPEPVDYKLISVPDWKIQNPEKYQETKAQICDDITAYSYLNTQQLQKEQDKYQKDNELLKKTEEIYEEPSKAGQFYLNIWFLANFLSGLYTGSFVWQYENTMYPESWHRFVYMFFFGLFGFYSGKYYFERRYIEGKYFSWFSWEGLATGFALTVCALSYFSNLIIPYYFTGNTSVVTQAIQLIGFIVFFSTTGLSLGNIFRRMLDELVESNKKGILIVVSAYLVSGLLFSLLFSGYGGMNHKPVFLVYAFIAMVMGFIWTFLSNRKPEYQNANSLWNAFYFGSSKASFTTRSNYKKTLSEREFKQWDEQNTIHYFAENERSMAAAKGGVGVVCLFFFNWLSGIFPWCLVDLLRKYF